MLNTWERSKPKLYDSILGSVKKAIKYRKNKVEINLDTKYNVTSESLAELGKQHEIKRITELLRKEMKDYNIQSILKAGDITSIISFENAPCIISRKIILELTLSKKSI